MAAPAAAGATAPDARERLRQNFLHHPPHAHPSRWEHLWQSNDMPWDQGRPNPALVDLLRAPHSPQTQTQTQTPSPLLPLPQLAPPSGDKAAAAAPHQRIRRPRALVPGCGRGYDVLLLASHGFDAVGVEGAATAVAAAREGARGHEDRDEYGVWDEQVGRGEARFVLGDWFEDGWVEEVAAGGGGDGAAEREEDGGWDLIYDYTFFCALPPPLRPRWAARMAQLLSPTGVLVCLEFPTYKPVSAGGPPWAVRPAYYVAYLSKPGEEVQFDEAGAVVGVDEEEPERSDRGLVRVAHWQPERTHEIGKGTDWISVWRRQ
ncbi:hypothetical protein MBLNU459_g6332t1 [Dothideomycetes sp. NU459]